MKLEERAQSILRNLGCPVTPVNMRFMVDCLIAAINDNLEEIAREIEALEPGTNAQTPAEMVRAMKVETR